MSQPFFVKAIWDPEAEVWCSESDIPGLVIETATLAEFESLARHFAPDLLSENLGISGPVPIKFEAAGSFDVVAA